LALAGAEPEDLRSWLTVCYALLIRANTSSMTAPAQVIDEFEKRAKLWLLDEQTWGVGADAVAGQQGLEALIARQDG